MGKFLVSVILFLVVLLNTNNSLVKKLNQFLPAKTDGSDYLALKEMALTRMDPILPDSKLLDVPLINQMDEPHLKNGCEVTSLAMVLNYNGIKVTKNELANKIAKVPMNYPNNKLGNPNIGFVGDMVNGPGLSVYNGPIFDLAQKYAGKKVVNLTGSPFTDLLKKVSKGEPVWVIITSNFKPGAKYQRWDTVQGTIYVTYSEHSAVITGYDQKFIYVNDPFGYKNKKVDRQSFVDSWEEMGKQAVVIEK